MGLRDDPYGASWSQIYSTENNLSYYAFLTELLRSPVIGKAQRAAITQERDHIENWLVKVAFDPHRGLMNRGTNLEGKDATAAQTYTVHDFHAVFAEELVRRGAARSGLTWHFARPPVIDLEYEMDCRRVLRELVV